MPDLFTPLNWNDGPAGGTPASVARGPRRWEAGIEALDVQGDSHDSRISSLESALASLVGNADVMTTAERLTVTPTEGKLVVDSDLPALLIGTGTGWLKCDLTALSGAGGGTTTPVLTGETRAGGTIGEIALSWPAITGATAITVREARSPDGVSGMPLAGDATSNVRTPGTAGGYDYWITATVGGVETPASNHYVTTLPFDSGGGGGGGGIGTPADILNIGTGATQNHFNVGVGYSTGHRDHTQQEIIDGYAEVPYFTPNAAGDAVQMQVFANGGTTSSGTIHPRVELRELMTTDANKAAWNSGSGSHVMSGTSTVTHLPADSESSSSPKPWTCFAQIHDDKGDVVRLQVEGSSTSSLALKARTHSPDGDASEVTTTIQSSYTIGDPIDWKIEVIGGTCKIYIGGVVKKTVSLSGGGCYFKAGTYAQFSTGSSDGGYRSTSYASTDVKNLVVTHS